MNVIVDTCIWFALADPKDSYSKYAGTIEGLLQPHKILVSYPSLYEAINTRLMRNQRGQAYNLFAYLNRHEKVELITDDVYRERAFEAVQFYLRQGKNYSLVDMVIRLMMEDVNLGQIAVMTFNVEDFAGVNSTEIINPIDKY